VVPGNPPLVKTITRNNNNYLSEAAEYFRTTSHPVALTGAGISVGSGIADFRSPGGLWTFFSPDEYATLEVFLHDPEKAWRLYRKLGKELLGKKPNRGHHALADLEENGLLSGLITQNVDGLHQAAGNSKVLEIHGDHQRLHCLQCGNIVPVIKEHYDMKDVPECQLCFYPLKPNIVLFGEPVKNLDKIQNMISTCDLLLVIGTSAKVFPAAGIPERIKQQGGAIYEFNREQVLSLSDYFFEGDLGSTLPLFSDAVFNSR
jgi:NAD-dependent deacetylase